MRKSFSGYARYLLATSLALGAPARALAQGDVVATGRIVGRVIDAGSGAGLSDVQLQVAGSTLGAVSGVDGRFSVAGVAAGQATLIARRLGYQPKTVTNVEVRGGRATELNVALSEAARRLATEVVTASAERGSVASALDAQRTATGITNSVTSEQIAKSPDSDAAQAVQRVSGVTVQDGKYVFVRGLGERYTTTSLNGARIPSPEPERKVVPLDLFPSGLLQSITTSKTFTADQSGDFSGAQVDIRTREFPAERRLAFSLASGVNPSAVRGGLPAAPGTGPEWAALVGSARDVPDAVIVAGDFSARPPQDHLNEMVRAFRNVWTPRSGTSLPNGSFSASLGGNDPLLFRHLVGYLASATYSRGQEARAAEVRAVAQPGDAPGSTFESDRYVGNTGRSSVLAGGLLNLSTLLGKRTRLTLHNTYNRSSDNEARRETGSSENLGAELRVDRLRYVERTVWSSQLAAEHDVGRQRLDWALSSSRVGRREPDRSEIVYVLDADAARTPRWLSGSSEGAVRTFTELRESSAEGRANYRFTFGEGAAAPVVRAGGLLRRTQRNADNRAYGITASGLTAAERALSAEEIFDGRFAAPGQNVFSVAPLAQGGSYGAVDELAAGFLSGEVNLGAGLRVIAGARVERSRVDLTAEPTIGEAVTTTPRYTDVLPSLALNVKVAERQAVRLSLSQTLSRPEYRELAPVLYREVLGGDNVKGNAELRRSLIANADLRWEWYPDEGEVLSVGVFAKRFRDPIERVYLATSGTRLVTFVNAEEARNLGFEVEARKGLGALAEALSPLTLSANATIMRSTITIGRADASKLSEDRAMVGQSPYVVNAGLTYQRAATGASATMLYNAVGRRVYSASEAPLPDVYEQARQGLDLSLRVPVGGGVSARADFRNLLDTPYEIVQGSVVRERYRAGRIFQLGLSWQ